MNRSTRRAAGSVAEAVEDSQPVPVVAPTPTRRPFEIDEVEALPEEADGVLDLHEGASDFVPVDPPTTPHHDERTDPPEPIRGRSTSRAGRSERPRRHSGRVRSRSTSSASPGRSGRTVTPSAA